VVHWISHTYAQRAVQKSLGIDKATVNHLHPSRLFEDLPKQVWRTTWYQRHGQDPDLRTVPVSSAACRDCGPFTSQFHMALHSKSTPHTLNTTLSTRVTAGHTTCTAPDGLLHIMVCSRCMNTRKGQVIQGRKITD
jgi:hypothetical protein